MDGSPDFTLPFSRHESLDTPRIPPRRGIGWVLGWALPAAVFLAAGVMTFHLTSALITERIMAEAAEAGVTEASLPRATPRTVRSVVQQRLEQAGISSSAAQIYLTIDDRSVPPGHRFRSADPITVWIAMPGCEGTWRWLRTGDQRITSTRLTVSAGS